MALAGSDFVLFILLLITGVCSADHNSFTLENGHSLPLIGLGVGNLAYNLIAPTIEQACQHHGVSFIDTAAASNNNGHIKAGLQNTELSYKVQVQSKVWYTYLGKERTKISLLSTLNELGREVDITMLLHWPRCRSDISWMHCEEEEAALHPNVKAAGPAPHLDQNAWRGSWEALEESYQRGELKAIGVSNFDTRELTELLAFATVKPHILQGNVWSFLYDPHLMKLCRDHHILFQAYNVMNGFMAPSAIQRVPHAFHALTRLAQASSSIDNMNSQCGQWAVQGECGRNPEYMNNNCALECANTTSPAQILLRWLTQEGIAVIPRTSSLSHLRENSPESVARVPLLDDQQVSIVRQVAKALISGRDLEKELGVVATFTRSHPPDEHGPVSVFWVNEDTGEEVLTGKLHAGEETHVETHTGHEFLVRSGNGELKQKYRVTSAFGTQHFHIGEL